MRTPATPYITTCAYPLRMSFFCEWCVAWIVGMVVAMSVLVGVVALRRRQRAPAFACVFDDEEQSIVMLLEDNARVKAHRA
jgi:hypothetical protein